MNCALCFTLFAERSTTPFAGGFALAAHGIVRATEDIDLMIEEADLNKLGNAVQPLGFWLQPVPFIFHDGAVTIRRFLKTGSPDFLILDVLIVTPATRPAWETRRQLDTDFGSVPVVSRAGLIQLKTCGAAARTSTTSKNSTLMKTNKVDMSPGAVTRRWQRVSELVRACRALAGNRRRPERPQTSSRETNAKPPR